ncbi:MAG: hypothetical protein EA398_15780 [Deltaproteobacteria bacterium]|nr:MAG: hypothetical protein EA398_15780 [Deltaproteobacteria bacterium]
MVRFGGVVPVAEAYGGADMGVSLEVGYHILAGRLGIEPRFATRFRAQDGPASTGGFAEVLFDLTAVHYLVNGPISPLVGGGLGVRYATASWLETRRDGQALQFVQEDRRTQSGWGLGGQIRTGVRFAMLAAVVDYNLNTVSIADRSVQQSVSFGIGVHF